MLKGEASYFPHSYGVQSSTVTVIFDGILLLTALGGLAALRRRKTADNSSETRS
jgi:hypothetical protein